MSDVVVIGAGLAGLTVDADGQHDPASLPLLR